MSSVLSIFFPTPSPGRHLIHPSEAYQLALHTLDQYRGTIVACRYCPPPSLTRPESLETLKGNFYDAIAQIVLAQPHMQTGLTGENTKNPAFVRLDSLDIRNHVDWKSFDGSSDLETLYLELEQSQLDSRFDHLSTRPGWRVIIMHQIGAEYMHVLYIWNHPHHDGMSSKIFHQQLLRNLHENFVQNKKTTRKVPGDSDDWILHLRDPSDRLPPNPEILTSWPMTLAFLLKSLWKELKPPAVFPPGKMHAHWSPIQSTPYVTRFRSFVLDNDTVTKVTSACRPHQTTVTGLVEALILVSMTCALKDMEGFASRIPYDLRLILPSNTAQYPWLRPKESMCNYVSVVDHEYNPKLVATIRSKMTVDSIDSSLSADVLKTVWSVAAQVRRRIQERLDSGVRNDMIGIMKFVSDWRIQQQREASRTRYFSWLFTNLGVLDREIADSREQEERWSLRSAELALSAEVASGAINVAIATVKGEQMRVTCSWQDCAVESELGERLTGDLERWMKQIGSQH